MHTVDEIAELLDLHPKTVQRFLREGRLEGHKIGREWRISDESLRRFCHGELKPATAVTTPPPRSEEPLDERIQVSAVIELRDTNNDEVSRISNSLLAMLNSKDPSWGASRYDLLHQPEERKARFVLHGTPAFLSTIFQLLELVTGDQPAARFARPAKVERP